jgi:hypothetical protein
MTTRAARIHVGLKRYHARRRQAIADVRTPRYEPLNPETFGKPAPAPLPFQGGRKSASKARHYLTYEECALEAGKWRWFVRTPHGMPLDAVEDYVSARLKLIECSLPNCLNLHIETPF